MPLKICNSCKKALTHDSFHKDSKSKDGRKSICKDCRSTRRLPKKEPNRKKFDRNLNHRVYISIKKDIHGSIWEDIFGYTLKDLKEHLESRFDQNMTWDNYGSYWWIDKIIPCSRYRYSALGELQKCWSLKNLRPLHKKACQKKSNKLYLSLVEEYSLFDILPIGSIQFDKEEDNESTFNRGLTQ